MTHYPPRHDPLRYGPGRQGGLTLIEILVTVFILAVGLLGLAGLQSSSVRGGMDIAQRSQTLWLANDLADRMRANPSGMANYESLDLTTASACFSPATNCNTNVCDAQQTAAFDMWEVGCGQVAGADVVASAVDSLNITAINVDCASASCLNENEAIYNVQVVYISTMVNSSQIMDADERSNQEEQSISIRVVPTYVPIAIN